jgi:Domain of unknown function (DUF3846)
MDGIQREAMRIDIDGSQRPVTRGADEGAWLKTLQDAVGGYLELVAIPGMPELCMLADEEGLWKNLPDNLAASLLAEQRIVGPVVVLPRALMD